MRIGFVGLGSMGLPMALNLAQAGHSVSAWNRTPSRAKAVEEAGGRAAATAAEAAAEAEVLVTMLADDSAVSGVVFGEEAVPEGILAALPKGAVHASASTISVALSRRLAQAHREAGQEFVAMPVFGRPQAAEARKLTVVAAGPAAARERCRPIFEAVGQATHELGDDAAAAAVVKLAGNFLIAAMMEGLAEAYALARKSGIEAARFLEIVNGGLIRSPLYESYGTLMAEERFEPAGFKLRLGLKDVRLALAAADAAAVPMPLAGLAHDHLLSALARGWGEMDWTVLARVVSEAAGL